MFLFLAATQATQAAEPAFSYPRLVSANGYGVIVFTESDGTGVIDLFSDHLYQQGSPGDDPVWDLLYDTYFGVRINGGAAWLSTAGEYGYVSDTAVMRIERPWADVSITEYAVAPMTLPHPGYLQLLHVRNDGTETLDEVEVFSLHNAHIGTPQGEVNTGDESLTASAAGIIESGSATGLVMSFLPTSTPTATGCADVYTTVLNGGDLGGDCTSDGDDRVGGMQWSVGPLAPGEEVWVGVVSAFASGNDTTAPEIVSDWRAGRDAPTLLADEQAYWSNWLAQGTPPDDLTEAEAAIYRQALIALKMGQVREDGPANGQILASLPAAAPVGEFQHTWNITWVRDGAYAIRALNEAGFPDEAAASLAFQIQEGCCGEYTDYIGGIDYALSLCRYYGNGMEWSDDDGTGPNIELDNFGLYLWAFSEHIAATDDDAFLAEHADRVLDGIADVLVASVDAEVDLIIADSSIWERHWNGYQKHFTYTSTWAVAGLRGAADLADRLGDPRGETYRAVADQIAAGITAALIKDDVLVGNLEELEAGGDYLDAAAIDAFNNGTLDPQGTTAAATLAAFVQGLAVPSGHGFKRNDDGDLYDEQEWVMIDLRIAEAYRRGCRPEEGQAIEDWITDQALANNGIIPELMAPETADYAGPAPMMGFGSGLYVLSMHNRAVAAAGCEDAGSDSGVHDSDEPTDTDSSVDLHPVDGGDCGCAAGGGSGGFLLAGLLLVTLRRREQSAR
ncbi:MAG: GH15 family glucan-1,4-alpha-glucosidase [Myxococcota bacterium]|jgi:GH15 family glucan-1,4-alpha-glucosidase